MTQEELFREIDEDMERQRYEALWKKYGGLAIIVVAAIIGVATAWTIMQQHKEQMQFTRTAQVISAMVDAENNVAKGVPELLDFATSNKGTSQAAMAEIKAANVDAQQGKHDDAVKIYDTLANDDKVEPEYRQFAQLQSVRLQADSGDAAALLGKLQPLTAEKQPWRFSAMELAGYIAYRSGDKDKAKQYFTDLSQNTDAPTSLTARASEMLRLLAE